MLIIAKKKKLTSQATKITNKKQGGYTMNKRELIMTTLEKMRYNPEIDKDDDIVFRYQMKTICLLTGDEEDSYISLLHPQFYEIDDGEETLVLAICNRMTRDLKLVKVYIDQTFENVTASCEFIYTNEESLEQNIKFSLQLLGIVRSVFRDNLKELSEESN